MSEIKTVISVAKLTTEVVLTLCAHNCIFNVRTKGEASMPGAATKPEKARGENINLRVSRGQKSLIDRAAQALGRNRSDFMLETACREAESVLLDRRYFALPDDEFKRFTAMLDKPPTSNPRLARLLRTRAPWDK
jgi:uncharacterized protein (DUF1778 family)